MRETKRVVTVIPATINPRTRLPELTIQKRRVAGYARVSTDKDEQYTSYEAQVEYYTQLIQCNPDWEFVNVYTDEGISGLNTKKRDGFNEMIADALAGKIDLIITKSVSRFARNTVDSLSTIRKLKAHNVECYFEKENIYTFDGKGELLLTIMSSLAQEESRSISENVTWGQRRRFEEGRVSFAYSSFLGYDKGKNKCDPPVINPEQAKVVKRIYRMFMEGKTPCNIAKALTADGILTPRQKTVWSTSTIESILTNEKYKGAAILQKEFTTDFLTKTMKTNEGEVPQYYVENSHEAIIQPDEWDAVQKEFARRRSLGRKHNSNSIFSARLVCGDCGAFFGSKVWNSTDKYRRTIWQCNSKFKGEVKCTTPHLDEETIKKRFVMAFNSLFSMKNELLARAEQIKTMFTDCSSIDAEIQRFNGELEDLADLTRHCIEENARSAMNQQEFKERYDGYLKRFNDIQSTIDDLNQQRSARLARADRFDAFIHTMQGIDSDLPEFDEKVWLTTIERVTVYHDGRLLFRFNNGTEIEN